MINPSTSGWIDKFFNKNNTNFIDYQDNYFHFYDDIRKSGFIYGYTIDIPLIEKISLEGLSQDEIIKIGLVNALYSIYKFARKDTDFELFIIETNAFYKIIQHENYNFLKSFLPSEKNSIKLEAIIDNRIQTNENFVSKNFSHIITNALLFIDVLAFHHYLINKTISSKYVKELEINCIKFVVLTFDIKQKKSKYDELLIKIFENSLRFTKYSKIEKPSLTDINVDNYPFDIERLFFLDIIEMALWSDSNLEDREYQFLEKIIKKLKLSDSYLKTSCQNIDSFIKQYKSEIPYFNYSNPVKHFYNQTNKTVTKLITRNKKRLINEISKSKELMYLLAKSTSKELDANEKKKVKKQLLDICKTIPSLTIFLLPGGGILLPILIKYIPQLLPSSFNENLED